MRKIILHVDKTWNVELIILNPIKHTTARWVEKLHFSSALNFYIQIFLLPGEKKKQENDLTKISQNLYLLMEPEMFPEGIMENVFTKTQLYTFSHIPWDQRTNIWSNYPQIPLLSLPKLISKLY